MKRRLTTVILTTIMALSAGCTTLGEGQLTREQLAIATKLAREKILTELNLTKLEQKIIKGDSPRISYYILADTYAQYDFQWQLSNGTITSLSGTGNILTLEDAMVQKIKKSR